MGTDRSGLLMLLLGILIFSSSVQGNLDGLFFVFLKLCFLLDYLMTSTFFFLSERNRHVQKMVDDG
jgi:low temperature requirement protein LtrA